MVRTGGAAGDAGSMVRTGGAAAGGDDSVVSSFIWREAERRATVTDARRFRGDMERAVTVPVNWDGTGWKATNTAAARRLGIRREDSAIHNFVQR